MAKSRLVLVGDTTMKIYSFISKAFIFWLILSVNGVVCAGITEKGSGMVFGDNHAFFFTAPKGWVLDNQSGVKQGIHMIFYPVGETWSSSPIMAYANTITKDKKIRSVHDQVIQTINELHASGSPNSRAEKKPSIKLADGSEFEVYYFTGDKWGNYEAIAYIEEQSTINFLVFNSRTKKAFDKHITVFSELISSYRNAYSKNVNEDLFQQLHNQAIERTKTTEGKAYETKVINLLGPSMANLMKECTSYATNDQPSEFGAIFRIDSDGNISEAFARPITGLTTCFKGALLKQKVPPHQFGSFLLHIKMRIKE